MRMLIVLTAGVSLALGLQALDNAPAANWSAQVRAAKDASERNDFAEAARLLSASLDSAPSPDQRAVTRVSYGIALYQAGHNSQAKDALEQGLAELEHVAGVDESRATAARELARVDRLLGDYPSAERVLRAAITAQGEHPNAQALLMADLANLSREQARFADARGLLGDAAKLPGLAWQPRACLIMESAELARLTGRPDESVTLWNQVSALATHEHSTEFDAAVAGGTGDAWLAAGNIARAEPLLRQAVYILRNTKGLGSPQLPTALEALSRLYLAENKLALAEQNIDEAVRLNTAGLGLDHPQTAAMIERRAVILLRRGETQGALDDLAQAKAVMTAHFGPDAPAVASVLALEGDARQQANQPIDAVKAYGLAWAAFRKSNIDATEYLSSLLERYAKALKAAHRPDEARALIHSFRAK